MSSLPSVRSLPQFTITTNADQTPDDYKSEDICLSALEVLSLELHARNTLTVRGRDGKELPYRQCVADIVTLLARLDAKKTRIINISFDTRHTSHIISDDDFLDCLRNARKGIEDLVAGKHFPSLQAINVVIIRDGDSELEATVPIWRDRFNSCFPLLADRGLLHITGKKYIVTE